MSKPFKKIVEERRRGSISIKYAVRGFWSDNQIRVDQEHSYGDGTWEAPTINRSCGGHEKGSAKQQIDADANFAAALLDAVREARRLMKRVGKPSGAGERAK